MDEFLTRDYLLAKRLEELEPACAEFQLVTMQRYQLVSECRNTMISQKELMIEDAFCKHCKVHCVVEQRSSSMICTKCGVCIFIHDNEEYDYFRTTTYNHRPIHHYSPTEHFAQTCHDFACLSKRTVPKYLLDRLRRDFSGRENTITSHEIFTWLCERKLRDFYGLRYHLANSLRTTPEFTLELVEVEALKILFNSRVRKMYQFMQAEDIGYISKRGVYRIYWPTAFILCRLLEEISREELTRYVPINNTKERLSLYMDYWKKFKAYANITMNEFGRNDNYQEDFFTTIKTTQRRM